MTVKRMAGAALCLLVVSAAVVSGAKPGTSTPVPLIVDVDEGAGMRIRGDGLTPVPDGLEYSGTRYEDGVHGVAASIDQYGNLIINFQTTRTVFRKLHYDYGAGDPLADADPPNNYLSTKHRAGDTTRMQELLVNASQCIIGGVYYTLEDAKKTQYWHSFQRDPDGVGGIDVGGTAFLKVTRTSSDTWTVESENDCDGGVSGVAHVFKTPTVGKFSFTSVGHSDMPMRLYLTRK